jgi:chromodomain-helicase-DNA-binding protein 6
MDHDDESDDEGDCAEAESVPAEDSLPKTKSVPAEDSLPKTVQSFPLDMGGGLIIENLGVVDPNLQMRGKQKGTHTLPIGYCSTRMSSRCDDPDSGQTTKWTQEIISKDGYIMFKLTAAEGLREPIVANNPTAAWKEVLKQKNMHRKIKSTPTKNTAISGPYFFGYKHPKVVALIQALDGASRSVKPRGGKKLTF